MSRTLETEFEKGIWTRVYALAFVEAMHARSQRTGVVDRDGQKAAAIQAKQLADSAVLFLPGGHDDPEPPD